MCDRSMNRNEPRIISMLCEIIGKGGGIVSGDEKSVRIQWKMMRLSHLEECKSPHTQCL